MVLRPELGPFPGRELLPGFCHLIVGFDLPLVVKLLSISWVVFRLRLRIESKMSFLSLVVRLGFRARWRRRCITGGLMASSGILPLMVRSDVTVVIIRTCIRTGRIVDARLTVLIISLTERVERCWECD